MWRSSFGVFVKKKVSRGVCLETPPKYKTEVRSLPRGPMFCFAGGRGDCSICRTFSNQLSTLVSTAQRSVQRRTPELSVPLVFFLPSSCLRPGRVRDDFVRHRVVTPGLWCSRGRLVSNLTGRSMSSAFFPLICCCLSEQKPSQNAY